MLFILFKLSVNHGVYGLNGVDHCFGILKTFDGKHCRKSTRIGHHVKFSSMIDSQGVGLLINIQNKTGVIVMGIQWYYDP